MIARWFFQPLLLLALLAWTGTTQAQPPSPGEVNSPPLPQGLDGGGPPQLNILQSIPGLDFGGDASGPRIFLNGKFEVEEGTNKGRLAITAELAPKFHTYSLTQKKSDKGHGPNATKLTLLPTTQAKLTGPFSADTAPHTHIDEAAWVGLSIEEHSGTVTWSAPVEFAAGVDPTKATLRVEFDGQVCANDCVPVKQIVDATYGGTYVLAKPTGEFKPEQAHVTWVGHAEPKVVAPGGTVKLVFTATPEAPFHIYAYEIQNEKEENKEKGFSPTLIALQKTSGWGVHAATTTAPIITKSAGLAGFSDLKYHEGAVTWTVELDVPKDAAPGAHELTGLIGFQTCTDEGCDMPTGAEFRVEVQVADKTEAGNVLVSFEPGKYTPAEKLAATTAPTLIRPAIRAPVTTAEVATAMVLALLGGFILNLMPCVLPVIGLKVIQFAEQAGQDRGKVFALNLAYCAGLMAVFMVLASLAVFLNLGWGEQFGVLWFKVLLAGLIFAMALSFLGVWEIPLPGFVGGSQTNELQKKEGYTGAFTKGVITTILATPCSGPFLGSVFGLTLKFPPSLTYLIFACIGLGMASPYLAISVFPSLIRWIPKPGAWMETLKQLMGFVLLGTVVYFFATIGSDYRVATLALLVGIWFACWWIGRTPVYAETKEKATAWIGGVAVAGIVGWSSFVFLGPHTSNLPWVPYSQAALAQARAEGKTVMIEFTANWCVTCQLNYKFAIDTQAVKSLVEKNNVVTMIADWTESNSPEGLAIKQKLEELDSKSIPLLAVYPAGGEDPIVLRDAIIQSQVLDALEKAGPSQGKTAEVARR